MNKADRIAKTLADEVARLTAENESLKAQVEALTANPRTALKAGLSAYYTERVHRPQGRVIHAVRIADNPWASPLRTEARTACGRNLGWDYTEVPEESLVTCKGCLSVLPEGSK